MPSEDPSTQDSSEPEPAGGQHDDGEIDLSSKRKKIFLGLDFGTLVRGFFGGNASAAIFILALICFFLLKEAWGFFPAQRTELTLGRQAGLETFAFVDKEYQEYKQAVAGFLRGFQADLVAPMADEQERTNAFRAARLHLKEEVEDQLSALSDAKEQREDLGDGDPARTARYDGVIETLTTTLGEHYLAAIDELERGSLPQFRPLSEEEVEEIKDALRTIEPGSRDKTTYEEALAAAYKEKQAVSWEATKPLNDAYLAFKAAGKPLDVLWRDLRNHTTETRDAALAAKSSPQQIAGMLSFALARMDEPDVCAAKYAVAIEAAASSEWIKPEAVLVYLDQIHRASDALGEKFAYANSVNEVRRNLVDDAVAHCTLELPDLAAALESGDVGRAADALAARVQSGDLTGEQAAALTELLGLEPGSREQILALRDHATDFPVPYPFDDRSDEIYTLIQRHGEVAAEMRSTTEALFAEHPLTASTPSATAEIEGARRAVSRALDKIDRNHSALSEWRHDEEIGTGLLLHSFFLNRTWTANSQIQDHYGILPLFTGSFIISTIALVLAVPFSIGAAIYVNQLAGIQEQQLLKPAIEFIQAIPSIVLGFIGIAVVGTLLQEVSQWGWLSWVPGFPIETRLNMLTAGLLLAFMAVPTIFSLAEDALNNVPQHFNEGSLALGATRLQTALRVIFPAATSGVVAAVLLGFGRIIGETMVVLLVAGNRINIPDFTKGIGVVTEPSHTMTGIIAQGLSEAPVGSIGYRALFMVGFVLFAISLIINFVAQRIVARSSHD